jgi:hypothetical protein
VDTEELLSEIPAECSFESGGRQYNFTNAQIYAQLSAVSRADEANRAAKIESFQRTLSLRLKSIDGYTKGVDPTAGPKLKQILARTEFKRVRSQDAEAILREQLLKAIIALFSLIAKNPEQAAFYANVFTWAVIGIVATFVVWKIVRWMWRASPGEISRDIIPFSPSAKEWWRWMEEARAAVERAEFREAVHSSYWAAISYLETSGAWKPDKARTPREYERLLSKSNPFYAQLIEIGTIFEVVWYGGRSPSPAECEEFLARVEGIACR